ncbi:MAG: transcription factor S [Thermoprotei archaeon]|nr:MAG: transcription factor S [Thermoprotei archaeon]
MAFCPRCGSLMVPQKVGGKTILKCRKCGFEKEATSGISVLREKKVIEHKPSEGIIVEQNLPRVLPTVRVECPRCGNKEAYWWTMQTRAADEPPTRFYRCTKCGYTWREYE